MEAWKYYTVTRSKLVTCEKKKGDNVEFMDAEISAENFGQYPAAGENFLEQLIHLSSWSII